MPITIERVKINLSTRKLRKKHEAKVIKAFELSRADARYFVAYVRYQHTSKRKPKVGRLLDILKPFTDKLFDKKLTEHMSNMSEKFVESRGQFRCLEWDETEFTHSPPPKPLH